MSRAQCERCHQWFSMFDPRLMAVRGGRWRCKEACAPPPLDLDDEGDDTHEAHARHQSREEALEYAGVDREDVAEARGRWRS